MTGQQAARVLFAELLNGTVAGARQTNEGALTLALAKVLLHDTTTLPSDFPRTEGIVTYADAAANTLEVFATWGVE